MYSSATTSTSIVLATSKNLYCNNMKYLLQHLKISVATSRSCPPWPPPGAPSAAGAAHPWQRGAVTGAGEQPPLPTQSPTITTTCAPLAARSCPPWLLPELFQRPVRGKARGSGGRRGARPGARACTAAGVVCPWHSSAHERGERLVLTRTSRNEWMRNGGGCGVDPASDISSSVWTFGS